MTFRISYMSLGSNIFMFGFFLKSMLKIDRGILKSNSILNHGIYWAVMEDDFDTDLVRQFYLVIRYNYVVNYDSTCDDFIIVQIVVECGTIWRCMMVRGCNAIRVLVVNFLCFCEIQFFGALLLCVI